MKKKDLERIYSESKSIRDAVKRGVPLKDVAELYLEVNDLVESGKWVELYVLEPRYGKEETYPYSSSIIRFWGPEGLLEGKKYITRSKAQRLFEEGKMGKTHELVRGSEIYLKDKSERPSPPPEGSRVLHRHWEIYDMWRYREKQKNKRLFLIMVSLITLSGLFFIFNINLKKIGYTILTGNLILNYLIIIAFVLSFLIIIVSLRKKL